MTSNSKRLRWALIIAVGLHVALALWLATGFRSRNLPEGGGYGGSHAGLPRTVPVEPSDAPILLPPAKTAPAAAAAAQVAPAKQNTASDPLALANNQAVATKPLPPPDARLLPPKAVVLPTLKRPASKAPAQLLPLKKPALSALAATPVPKAAPKPQQVAAAPKPAPVTPPAARKSVERAAKKSQLASKPVVKVKPEVRPSRPTAPQAAASSARTALPAGVAAPRAVVPKATAAAPVVRPPAAVRSAPPAVVALPTMGAPAATASTAEPVYQLPSGKLSMRLANPPPRTLGQASSASGGLAVEALEQPTVAAFTAPAPAVVFRAPTAVEASVPPIARSAAAERAPSSEPGQSFPPVTIYEAEAEAEAEPTVVASPSALAAAQPTSPARGGAGQSRASYFQGVTTLLKAANAQALSDALTAGKKLVVRMKFTVKRDGSLIQMGPAVATPDWAVAEAAKVLRDAAPYPEAPDDLPGKTVQLSYPVEIYAR